MSAAKRKAGPAAAESGPKKARPNGGSIAAFFAAPKPKPAEAAAPAARFDKQRWVAGLRPEQRQLLRLEIETLDDSWLAHLKDDVVSNEFLELKRFLGRETAAGRKWFPPEQDVYSW